MTRKANREPKLAGRIIVFKNQDIPLHFGHTSQQSKEFANVSLVGVSFSVSCLASVKIKITFFCVRDNTK